MITVEPTPEVTSGPFSVTSDDFTIGPANAPVTIIQYCDLQSIDCYGLGIITRKLLENHPEDLRLVIRPIPLLEQKGFDNSKIAVQAFIAAKQQDKQLEMYDLLFEKYGDWANITSTSVFESWLLKEVPALEIDKSKFQTDLRNRGTVDQMTSWYNTAKENGVVPPYPLVLINGAPVNVGLLYYEYLDQAINLIALGAKQFTECPPFDVDPAKQYTATLHTEKGDIVIELFPDKAPFAVNSFIFLARQKWFDDVTFHRVIPGFIAQAGDPSGTGQGGPGYFFKNEVSDLKFDRPGMVGMANSGPDTNGSQFFITFAPAPHLDGGYTIFGQVISGLDVAEMLTPRDPEQGFILPAGDKIISVEIEEK
jgi:cyclophilin family peptidyl-prolyl cis-trans isomerase